jgi:hypothetical protein
MIPSASSWAGPPRRVPLSLRIAQLFGGREARFGWLLLGVGILAGIVFGRPTDIVALLITLVFPLAGFLFLAIGVVRGRRRVRLLRGGPFATAVLKHKRKSGKPTRGAPFYELTFEFPAGGGALATATAYSRRPERLEDESPEPLLYDPANPAHVYLLDEMRPRPEVDSSGQLVGSPRAAAVAVALLAIVVAATVGAIVLVS